MSVYIYMSVYFCLYLYVVGVIYAIPVYKIIQQVLMFATMRSYILTVCGHSLVHISIWYSSLWGVVLLWCFWCFNEILMQWRWKNFEKPWKFKIKRKPLKPSFGSAAIAVHPLLVCVSRGWFGFPHAGEMSFYLALTAYHVSWSPTF